MARKSDIKKIGEQVQIDSQIEMLKRQIREKEARHKDTLKYVSTLETRLGWAEAIKAPPRIREWTETKAKKTTKAVAMVDLSDWHVGEVVTLDGTNGMNEFNPKIAERRIKRVFEKIPEYIERYVPMSNRLYLSLLGDFITGHIHPELAESNSMFPVEECLFASDHICSGIHYLLPRIKGDIVLPCCVGNHGRTTEKRRIKTNAQNSFEWGMYNQLVRYFRNEPRVNFLLTEGYHNIVEIYGRKVRYHHGEAFNYGGGVGGPLIPILKKTAAWNNSPMKCELDKFGHLHTFMNYKGIVGNGSLIGYSDFAISFGGAYEPPAQSFTVFSEKRGKHLTTEIFCDA